MASKHTEEEMSEKKIREINRVLNEETANVEMIKSSLASIGNNVFGESGLQSFAKLDGISAILRAMETYKKNEDVQKKACTALGNLAGGDNREHFIYYLEKSPGENIACDNENKKQIAKEGGITAVLQAMKVHETSEGVQERACRALGNIALLNYENSNHTVKEGGVTAILRAMKTHEMSANVQGWACRALGDLIFSFFANEDDFERNVAQIVGCIATVIHAMKKHKLSAHVQKWACRALFFCMCVARDESWKQIQDCQIWTIFLRAMKTHEMDVGVQEWVCFAIAVLGTQGISGQIAKEGVIAAIRCAIKTHTTSAGVLGAACNALVRFDEDGGIAALIRVMKTNEKSMIIQEQACSAIEGCNRYNNDVRDPLAKEGGVAAILCAMETHETSESVQKYASQALGYLAEDDAKRQKQIAKEGGITAILHAIKTHTTSAGVLAEACKALIHFAEDGGIAALIRVMKTNEKSMIIQEQACRAIAVRTRYRWSNVRDPLAKEGVVATILGAMKTHETSESVQKYASQALGHLAEDDAKRQKHIAKEGGITAILHAIKTHETSAGVLEEACKALIHFAEDGGIAALIRVMKTNEKSMIIQEQACRAIAVRTRYRWSNVRDPLAKEGVVATILGAMKTHETSESVQKYASQALGHLAEDDAKRQKHIAKEGGITAILHAIKTHETSAGVLEEACKTLTHFAENGGIAALIRVMKTNETSESVQKYASQALGHLAEDAKRQRQIAKEGGITAILHAIKTHETSAGVLEEACKTLTHFAEDGGIAALIRVMKTNEKSMIIQEQACSVIAGHTRYNYVVRDTLAKEGGVAAILCAMKTHETSESVQKYASQALGHLAEDDAKRQKQIAKEGGITAILHAIKTHITSESLQRDAFGALVNLLSHTEIQTQIAKEGGVGTILYAMKLHKTSEEVQEIACRILRIVAFGNEKNKKRFVEEGGIAAILHTMKAHEMKWEVQSTSCGALGVLAVDNTKYQNQIAREGGIAAILHAMKMHETSAGVLEEACYAISSLVGGNKENQKQVAKEGGIAAILRAITTASVSQGSSFAAYAALAAMSCFYDAKKKKLSICNGVLPRFDLLASLNVLEELDLSNNELRHIPPFVGLLTSLRRLDLSNNRLTQVPKEIGSLTGLAPGYIFNRSGGLVLDGNPIAKPPFETCARGVLAIRAWWDAVEADFGAVEASYDKKVLFVGTGGAGKTSLRMNLTDAHGKRTKEGYDRATIGIDVREMTCDKATLSLWDFGGQEEYYQTHALFLTSRSIYLLVVDIAAYDPQSPEHFTVHVQQWVDKLRAKIHGAVEITVVATKIDGVTDAKDLDRRVENLWHRLVDADRERRRRRGTPEGASSIRLPQTARDILRVCSADGRGVEALRAHLVALTRLQPVWMAASWMALRKSIQKIGKGPLSRVSRRDVDAAALKVAEIHAKNLSKRSNAPKVLTNVPGALRLFHDLGWVLWYGKNATLQTSIFARPVAVVDMLKSIVRHNMSSHVRRLLDNGTLVESAAVPPGSTLRELKRGVLTRRLIEVLWHEYKLHERKDLNALTSLCCTLDLLVPFGGRGGGIDGFFAPFYLEELPLRREHLRTLALPVLRLDLSLSARCRIGRLYEFELYVPSGLFCRMLVRWLKRLPTAFDWSAWRNGFRIEGGGVLRAAIVWWQHPRNRGGYLAFHAIAEDARRAWDALTPLLNELDNVLKMHRHVEYVTYAMYWTACENEENSAPVVLSMDTVRHVLGKAEAGATTITISGKIYRVAHLLDVRPSVSASAPGRSFVSVSKTLEAEQRAESGDKSPFLLSCKQGSKPILHVACYFSTDGKSLWIRSGTSDDGARSVPLRGLHHEDTKKDGCVRKLRLFRENSVDWSFDFRARAPDDAEELVQFRSVLLKKLMHLGCMVSLSYADFKSRAWHEVGSGTYGTTFAAVFYGKTVAIKAVPMSKVDKKELEILKRVVGYGGHLHLVRYYGHFVQTRENDENRMCIAMEMCDTDLETVLHASNASEWTTKKHEWEYRDMWCRSFFWRTIRGIAVGVHFMHENGIVHRDLKPANILMKPQDDGSLVPKICDFGMSKVCRHGNIVQDASGCVGTPVYTPHMDIGGYNTQYIPEKFDAYSFGVMAWEMWTRVKPFSEFAQPIVWQHKVRTEAFRPPTTPDESGAVVIRTHSSTSVTSSLEWPKLVHLVGVSFPPRLRELIVKCWAQRCEDRWSFAQIVPKIGNTHLPLLSGGSGWFGDVENLDGGGGASSKRDETGSGSVLSGEDDAPPRAPPLEKLTGGGTNDESKKSAPEVRLTIIQEREAWVRGFLAKIEMEVYADAIIEKGFGSKRRLLQLKNEEVVRKHFPQIKDGELAQFLSDLSVLRAESKDM
eukprot:g1128.t1